jgi:uncharacterized protein YegP (UPF0339 family)
MAAKFEITKDAEGRFRFWLRARNGAIIATSGEDYESMAGVKNAIASVRKNAPDAEVVDLTGHAQTQS